MTDNTSSLRDALIQNAAEQYGCMPEYLWAKFPDDAVLRHKHNQKWFALLMTVDRNKLGLEGECPVYILNVKTDPELSGMLAGTPGFLPAYHMHKGNWITILLDGSVDMAKILSLLDMSYELTSGKSANHHSNSHAASGGTNHH